MDFKVIWSPSARLDLKELVTYIAEDSSEIAQRFGLALIDATKTLASFPGKGRSVPELSSPEIREVIFKPYRIIYRVKENEKSSRLCGCGMQPGELLNFRTMNPNQAVVQTSGSCASRR